MKIEEGKFKITKPCAYSFALFIIFFTGILLRLKGLLINPSMWHDECALAWNIKFKTYLELFGNLRFLQMAPPLFLVATKYLVNIFSVQNTLAVCDFVMRLIPFVCSVISIFIFYLISKNLFKTKKAVLLSLLFFVINKVLIDYSFEFKPYSSDMLCILLLVLFFIKVDISTMDYKKASKFSLGFCVMPWFSFVSLFFMGAGFITLFWGKKFSDYKKALILILPVSVSFLLYLKLYVLTVYSGNAKGLADFWANQFILPDFSNFLYLLVENARYFFFPVKSILFVFTLSIFGYFLYLKEKKYDFIRIISFAFLFLVLASVLHFYPFSKRLVIFLIPVFILLFVKPLDVLDFGKKIRFGLVIFLTSLILIPQLQYTFGNLFVKANKGEFSREMISYMVPHLKKDDVIFVNNASRAQNCYYSSFFDIKNKVIYENLGNIPDYRYEKLLKDLPRGNYWLFLPYDYSPDSPVIEYVKNWALKNTKVNYLNQATQSVLMYVSIN